MILYHYTSHYCLPDIMRDGLSKGEVPLSDRECVNAVNLTTDPAPDGHGLDAAGHVWTAEESIQVFNATGSYIPPGSVNINKRAVRITAKVRSTDPKLKDYLQWARKQLQPEYLSRLVGAAGGMEKAQTWKLYFGTITPDAFMSVDILEPGEVAGVEFVNGGRRVGTMVP